MTADPPVPPPDNRRFELFKFYEEAAQRAKKGKGDAPVFMHCVRKGLRGFSNYGIQEWWMDSERLAGCSRRFCRCCQ